MYWNVDQSGWTVLVNEWNTNTQTSDFAAQDWGNGEVPSSQPFQFVGDFNGDGRTDFMYWEVGKAGWTVLLSDWNEVTQTGTFAAEFWGPGGGLGHWSDFTQASTQPFQFVGDFNANQQSGLMYLTDAGWRWASQAFRPRLAFEKTPEGMQLKWPDSAGNYQLQSATQLGGEWQDSSLPVSYDNGENKAIVIGNSSDPEAYYRLESR